jgi:hypothetical protein
MEKHFKVGDRVVRTRDGLGIRMHRPGVIVKCPEMHASWGANLTWILYDEPYGVYDGRGPFWISRVDCSKFEFENNKEEEVETVTDRLYEMMREGLTPEAMREAIAEAEQKAAVYQQGYEAGVKAAKEEAPVSGPLFELQYKGVWRTFHVVGVDSSGTNSDHDAILRVKEVTRGSVTHPVPLDKSYSISFPASTSPLYKVSAS